MTLEDVLDLMVEVADLVGARVSLGIQVRGDGSGRTTPGTLKDGTKTADCEFGPGVVQWDCSCEGSDSLESALQEKLAGFRGSHGEQPLFQVGVIRNA